MRSLNRDWSNPVKELTAPCLPKALSMLAIPLALFLFWLFVSQYFPSYPDFSEYEETKPDYEAFYSEALDQVKAFDNDYQLESVFLFFKEYSLATDSVVYIFGKPNSLIKFNVKCQYSKCKGFNQVGTKYYQEVFSNNQNVVESYYPDINSILDMAYTWLDENKVNGRTTISSISLSPKGKETNWRVDFENNIHRYPIYLEINPTTKEIIEDPYNADY